MERAPSGNKLLNAVFTVEDACAKAEAFFATIVFVVMIGFMLVQVFTRFILQIPMPWTEEFIRYAWMTMTFIGAGVALKENGHVEINLLPPFLEKIKDLRKRAKVVMFLDLFRSAVVFGFCIFMGRLSFQFLFRLMAIGQMTPALGIPKWWIDAIICLGFWLMAVHAALLFIRTLATQPKIEGGSAS